jgi:transketolase
MGPTHEPIEHVASLRLIPNLHVWRPADGLETASRGVWRSSGQTVPARSSSAVKNFRRSCVRGGIAEAELRRGGYLAAGDAQPHAVVAATGSELHLAMGAREALAAKGTKVNVVSLPCLERFHEQPQSYRDGLFPAGVPVATIEAGRTDPWRFLAGPKGLTLGIDGYGASAPAGVNAEKFGFTVETVTARLAAWLGR